MIAENPGLHIYTQNSQITRVPGILNLIRDQRNETRKPEDIPVGIYSLLQSLTELTDA